MAAALCPVLSAQDWKVKGNDHYKSGAYAEAIEAYTCALHTHNNGVEDVQLRQHLFLNRSKAYKQVGLAHLAYADAKLAASVLAFERSNDMEHLARCADNIQMWDEVIRAYWNLGILSHRASKSLERDGWQMKARAKLIDLWEARRRQGMIAGPAPGRTAGATVEALESLLQAVLSQNMEASAAPSTFTISRHGRTNHNSDTVVGALELKAVPGVEVRLSTLHGQGVFAVSSITKGSLVFETSPLIWQPVAMEPMRCGTCAKLVRGTVRCEGCWTPASRYCSASCKRDAERSYHKHECGIEEKECEEWRSVIEDSKDVAGARALLAVRILHHLSQHKQRVTEWAPLVQSGRFTVSQVTMKQQVPFASTWQQYLSLMDAAGISPTSCIVEFDEFLMLMTFLDQAAYPVWTNDHNSLLGTGVYAGLQTMINHACAPNSQVQFDPQTKGNKLQVVALEDIPAGREITVAYFPITQVREHRNARLCQQFGFATHCKCLLCAIEEVQTAQTK